MKRTQLLMILMSTFLFHQMAVEVFAYDIKPTCVNKCRYVGNTVVCDLPCDDPSGFESTAPAPRPSPGINTGTERSSSKPMSKPAKVVTAAVAIGAVGYALGPSLDTSSNSDDSAMTGAALGAAIGALTAMTITDSSNELLPRQEHYISAAQFFRNIPLFAYSESLPNGSKLSAMITLSTDVGRRSFSATTARERLEQQGGSFFGAICTYAF